MFIIFRLLPVIFLVSLTACASLSKDECLDADWYQIGLHDGKSGYKSSRLSEHRKACAEYHVSPDLTDYTQGRDAGLMSYCTPETGLQAGSNGEDYRGVCPLETEQAFLRKYHEGKTIYELSLEINTHQSRISTIENTLEHNRKKNKLSKKEIRRYKNEIKELTIRIEEKQKRLYYLKGKADLPM